MPNPDEKRKDKSDRGKDENRFGQFSGDLGAAAEAANDRSGRIIMLPEHFGTLSRAVRL